MHGKLQKGLTDIFRIYHVNQITDELKGLQEKATEINNRVTQI